MSQTDPALDTNASPARRSGRSARPHGSWSTSTPSGQAMPCSRSGWTASTRSWLALWPTASVTSRSRPTPTACAVSWSWTRTGTVCRWPRRPPDEGQSSDRSRPRPKPCQLTQGRCLGTNRSSSRWPKPVRAAGTPQEACGLTTTPPDFVMFTAAGLAAGSGWPERVLGAGGATTTSATGAARHRLVAAPGPRTDAGSRCTSARSRRAVGDAAAAR
jgi:hypothetical protein